VVKFFARTLGNPSPVGETTWDPIVKVAPNSVFLYRNPNAALIKRFSLIDYIPFLAASLYFAPDAFMGLPLIVPLLLWSVFLYK